jgi:putative oxidoreductase
MARGLLCSLSEEHTMERVTIPERIVFGRPREASEDASIHLVPRPATALIGRVALAAIFLVSGSAKIVDVAGTAEHMAAVGIPYPQTLAMVAGVVEILGALSLALGALTRIGALGLILFLIPTTLLFHDFWSLEGGERQTQLVQLLKNVGIAGGLLLLLSYGPGRYSVDALLRRPLEP